MRNIFIVVVSAGLIEPQAPACYLDGYWGRPTDDSMVDGIAGKFKFRGGKHYLPWSNNQEEM